MKVLGSPLSKDQMKNVKGGQKKTCAAICSGPNGIFYVPNLDECSVAPSACASRSAAYVGCECEPQPEV